jgi:hypothetical protein
LTEDDGGVWVLFLDPGADESQDFGDGPELTPTAPRPAAVLQAPGPDSDFGEPTEPGLSDIELAALARATNETDATDDELDHAVDAAMAAQLWWLENRS